MIDPVQMRRNLKVSDRDKDAQIKMLEMHALAVRYTEGINSPKRYYVYILLDPRKSGDYRYGDYKFRYEPFYVGMGKGNRWKSHLQCKEGKTEKNKLIWEIILNGKPYGVEFVFESENKLAVKEKETEVIRTIGKASMNDGPLLNTKE